MIVEFDIETRPLQPAFERAPDTDVSIIQQTASESGGLDMTINAARGRFDDFEAGLDSDDTVATWTRFSEDEEYRRYRITLTQEGRTLTTYPRWTKDGAVFLDGTRRRDWWRYRLQFLDEESLQRYVSYCRDNAIDLQPIRLSRTETSTPPERFGLTEKQARTLVSAMESGFFEVPRKCTLEELAAESNITHQALSERLRRGMSALVESTLR